jgi:superoxide dismutase, Cu-Zn family
MNPMRRVPPAVALLSAFAFLPPPAAGDQITKAKATLRSCADPTFIVGSALLVERPSSEDVKVVEVFISVRGLTPGKHAVHVHAAAACTPSPTCADAGSHLDLGPFGHNVPVTENHPYHSGDLVNIVVGADGRGSLLATTSRIALTQPAGRPPGRELSIFDGDGSAIVIHALPDLYCPDPANAACAGGARVACGAIVPTN